MHEKVIREAQAKGLLDACKEKLRQIAHTATWHRDNNKIDVSTFRDLRLETDAAEALWKASSGLSASAEPKP